MFHATQMRGSMGGGGFSHKAPVSATDMRCYFECIETFKRDCDLRLHLKLRHKDEDENELRRAFQDAEEEIALVSRSASTFQCAICPRKFNNIGSFYDHIRKGHNLVWLDYKEQYGRCEVESAPFECKICGRVVKYIRDSVDKHLKNVHAINWPQYIDRIRKMRNGQAPAELPNISFFECKICSSSVKFIFRKDHLKSTHKITELEYIELYKEDLNNNGGANSPNQNNNNAYIGTDKHSQPPVIPTQKDEYSQISNFDKDSSPGMNSPIQLNKSLPKPPKSAIQDKTNTGCSPCNTKFQTRRLFIEHCTTTHDMKFRTVSGATITARSSIPEKTNQQDVKIRPEQNDYLSVSNRSTNQMSNGTASSYEGFTRNNEYNAPNMYNNEESQDDNEEY